MKKALMTVVAFVVLGVGIYFVIGLLLNHPPSPTITFNEKKLEVARGSNCWEGVFRSVCADTISPPRLIEHHKIKPMIVLPESELKIEFEKEPNAHTLGVNKWLNENEVEDVSLNNNVLIAPSEKGVYIYDVHATWEKGSSSYAFVIEVR